MIALAVVLLIVGVVLIAFGYVLFANGAGVAPHERTEGDPTGVKRATSRTSWREAFRQVPRSVRLVRGHESTHEERLAGGGAVLMATGIATLFAAIVSVIVGLM